MNSPYTLPYTILVFKLLVNITIPQMESLILFPSVLGSRERNQLLLLEIFYSNLVTSFDMVPADAGIMNRYFTQYLPKQVLH